MSVVAALLIAQIVLAIAAIICGFRALHHGRKEKQHRDNALKSLAELDRILDGIQETIEEARTEAAKENK